MIWYKYKYKRWLITAIFGATIILGVIADVIAVTLFGFDQGNPFGGANRSTISIISIESSVPHTPLGATTMPTPIPPFGIRLQLALSMDDEHKRSRALRSITFDAIVIGDYWTAIRAASAIPFDTTQALELSSVATCAVEEGLYELATEAAFRVQEKSAREDLKYFVVLAADSFKFKQYRTNTELVARGSMSCYLEPTL